MTTVTDPNVFNIAIRGTFDDGQAIVKSIFNDIEFKKTALNLGAISIPSTGPGSLPSCLLYLQARCTHHDGRKGPGL